jgi:hypothetical protein
VLATIHGFGGGLGYETREEERVIVNLESTTAIALGEPVRFKMPLAARARRAIQLITSAILALLGIVAGQGPTMGAQHTLAEYFRPRQQLAFFEVYHIPDPISLYRSSVSLGQLLQMTPVNEYVRVDADSKAVADLYRALNDAVVDSGAECPDRVDARWAIVLTYRDQTTEAVGFGPVGKCVQLLSRQDLVDISPALLKYVERDFPFMRSRLRRAQ